jgi:hypothetical protein
MAARKVWKVSVSKIALFGRVLEFTDSAWIELPAGGNFTLIAGEEVALTDDVKATLSSKMAVILAVPGSLALPAKNGSAGYTLELPKDTALHFTEKKIELQADGSMTIAKAGTKIVWPGVRRPDSPLRPEHEVVAHHNGEVVFWLPAAGGMTIDHGDAQVRFPRTMARDQERALGVSGVKPSQ